MLAETKVYDAARTVVADKEQELREDSEKIRAAISKKREEKAATAGKLETLDTALQQSIDTTCPMCAQELPADAADKLKADREVVRAGFIAAQEEVFEIDKAIAADEKDLAASIAALGGIEWPMVPGDGTFDDFELSEVIEGITHIAIDEIKGIIERAKVAEVRLESIDVQAKANGEKIRTLAPQIEKLKETRDDDAADQHQVAVKKLELLRGEYQKASDEAARLGAEVANLEKGIAELREVKVELDDLKDSLAAKVTDAQEWRYLELACGPNGIQALELDALAPSIADAANELLAAAYDSRFQIEFNTTRIAGKGSKAKQVEDFEIIIHDSKDGSSQPLDTLSGGESVWIKKALYDAFGIIRAKNEGAMFLTVFLDEADGALDIASRVNYRRLLEAAHTKSGRIHTIVITHSPELQEMIAQRIVVRDLEPESREVA